ncbi:MAG: preprotein translocase subunit SecG [Syntrophobacteraceae bacterium]
MSFFIITIHVIASIALIAIVLLQTGKGAEMGAAFGGASQTLFGGTGGTTFMSKLTTAAAVIFMITCLLLSYKPSTQGTRSLMEDMPVEQTQTQPLPVLPEARPVQPQSPAPAPEAAPPKEQAAPQEAPKQEPAPAAKPEPQQQKKQEKAPAKK